MKQTSLQAQTSDPRWQRKRLKILDRDKWTCKRCGDTTTTLTVHHKHYRMVDGKFVDYWDYKSRDLVTLCNVCHEKEEERLSAIKDKIYFGVRSFCEDSHAIDSFVFAMKDLVVKKDKMLTGKDFDEMVDVYYTESQKNHAEKFFASIEGLLGDEDEVV